MIPAPYNSQVLITDHWLEPDDRENFLLLDYELGGIALNDPTQGLRVQTWTLSYAPDPDEMRVRDEASNSTVLFTRPDITQISLAWDQNMNPFVAFTETDQFGDQSAWFWWFDTDLADTVFTALPADAKNPVCCLDDKRETQTFSSDIVLAYVLNDNLYFRLQRDRYITQYFYAALEPDSICKRVGMNKKNRLQFLIQSPEREYICGY